MKKALLLLLAMSSVESWAAKAFIAPKVQESLMVKDQVPVLVVLKSQLDFSGRNWTGLKREKRIETIYRELVENANLTQKSLVDFLRNKKITHQRFFISNAVLIHQADSKLIQKISNMPEVEKVLGNPEVSLQRPLTLEMASSIRGVVGQNIISTGAERVWKELGITGENIVVGGQDTGYQWDHPALKGHYRGWNGRSASHDFHWHDSIHAPSNQLRSAYNKCGYNSSQPCDDDRHGTHTMGTIVGSEGNQNQIGMAPGAKWIGCRNMDAGVGTPASYLECFQFFLAPTPVSGDPFTSGRPDLAPHVINNSWGCNPDEGCTGDEMLPALKAMKAAGIVVVVSAGNDGPGCGTIQNPPAYHTDHILSVGAMNHRTGEIASFSSRGPSTFNGGVGPDVVAPGVNIRSSVPGSQYEEMSWSGTSMAGPHVAGQVALLLSAQPKLIGDTDSVIQIIRSTAENVSTSQSCGGVPGGQTPNNTYGFGRIKVFQSVQTALSL